MDHHAVKDARLGEVDEAFQVLDRVFDRVVLRVVIEQPADDLSRRLAPILARAYATGRPGKPRKNRHTCSLYVGVLNSKHTTMLPPESIQLTKARTQEIVRWAQFLVAARAEIKFEKDDTNWRPSCRPVTG